MLGSLVPSAFSYFGLDEVPYCRGDDRLMAGGDVVLGHFALVDDLTFRQVVSDVRLLQESVTLVFLVGENRSYGLVMPGLVACSGEGLWFVGEGAGDRADGHAA